MAQQIFYLHSCNEWKEYSSMNLLFIGTSQQKLKKKISKEIEDGNMEYGNIDLSPKEYVEVDLVNSSEFISSNLKNSFTCIYMTTSLLYHYNKSQTSLEYFNIGIH